MRFINKLFTDIYITLHINIFQVCTILNISFKSLQLIGALTSKPFAYKAWSWELNSSYVVDYSNFFNSKIRIDLKGLEIVWVLPWLSTGLSENWISDKTRFFYDGLTLNWVTKFFFRWKFFLQPVINFLFLFVDPLNQKYLNELNIFGNLEKLSKFKSSKENFYEYFHSFYESVVILNLYFSFYNFSTNLLKHQKNFFSFYPIFFNKKIHLSLIFLPSKLNNLKLFLNKFFFARKKTYLNSNFFHYINQFKKFDSLSIWKIPFIFLFNFLTFQNQKNFTFTIDNNFDILSLSAIKYLNFKKQINIMGLNTKLFKTFILKKHSFFFKMNVLNNNNILILVNTNLRVTNPILHLYIRKLVQTNNLIVINFGNNNLSFKHLNFGSKITTFINFVWGTSWLSSLFVKNYYYSFLVNFDITSFINFYLNKKFLNKNFLFFSNFTVRKKLFFLLKPIFFFISAYNYINILSNLSFSLKNNLIFSTPYFYKNIEKNFSNIYFYNNLISSKGNFFFETILSKNFYGLKKNFHLLFETNIVTKKVPNFWDSILPISTITENFFLTKNYFTWTTKSLFIKFGPWFSWSFFNYLKFIYIFSLYPFLWLCVSTLKFLDITFLFLNFWLNGSIYIDFLSARVINYKKSKIFIIAEESKIKNNFWFKINSNFFFVKTLNPWFSNISYIASSKYVSLGFNLVKKEKKTFF